MEFKDTKSSSLYIEEMRNKCKERYSELSLKYSYGSIELSEEEKLKRDKKIAELIRLSIENEFGCCYL